MKGKYFIFFSIILILVSCTRLPKEILAPRMKIDVSGEENKVFIEVSFYNDSYDTVFADYKGKLSLLDGNNETIITEEFTIDKIFPYSSSPALIQTNVSDEELEKILLLSQTSKEDLDKAKVLNDLYITSEMLALDDVSANKLDIIDVLEGESK